MHDALAKSPGSAAEIAKKFGVDLATVTDATPGSPVPTLGSVPEIDNALAQMKPNDVSAVLTLPANRLVVAVLTNSTAARPATFEEVEGKVRDRLIADKRWRRRQGEGEGSARTSFAPARISRRWPRNTSWK